MRWHNCVSSDPASSHLSFLHESAAPQGQNVTAISQTSPLHQATWRGKGQEVPTPCSFCKSEEYILRSLPTDYPSNLVAQNGVSFFLLPKPETSKGDGIVLHQSSPLRDERGLPGSMKSLIIELSSVPLARRETAVEEGTGAVCHCSVLSELHVALLITSLLFGSLPLLLE